jgi:hypothetical protein
VASPHGWRAPACADVSWNQRRPSLEDDASGTISLVQRCWAECHCGHTGNRIQKKRDDKVGAPSPCHPLRSATHRQSLFMPLRPFLMPSSAQRAQGIVKNMNPFSTKKLGSMSGGMKYIPGTTP